MLKYKICIIQLLIFLIIVNIQKISCISNINTNFLKISKNTLNDDDMNINKFIRKNKNNIIIKSSNINFNNKKLLNIRGGEMISRGKKRKKKSIFNLLIETLNDIAPATRKYLLLCIFCTIIHIIGLPAPNLFSLDSNKLYEIWRPITSISYFGAPSMSMANSMYFLVRYGQTLENEYGTGIHTWFLTIQVILLAIIGYIMKFPFQAQSMITAAVYVCSHIRPLEKMPFQFGLTITSWQLPFCLMIIDCLSQQNAQAAWPHIIGIISGHTYHFFTKVWPNMGGKAYLKAPEWFIKRFGGKKSNTNIKGMDFRNSGSSSSSSSRRSNSNRSSNNKSNSKSRNNNSKKGNRKRSSSGKGRKLNS